MNDVKEMQATDPATVAPIEKLTGGQVKPTGPTEEEQEFISSEFQKLVGDLKLNQYGATAIEVFVNKVLQVMVKV